jgi:hypothetical protein
MTLETDLTLSQVEQIAALKNYPHPVAELVRIHLSELQQTAQDPIPKGETPQIFFTLAGEMEEMKPFPLTARYLVGIWAEIMDVEPVGPSERKLDILFGQTIALANISKIMARKKWRQFPSYWLTNEELPKGNRPELLTLREELDHLKTTINDLLRLQPKTLNQYNLADLLEQLKGGSDGKRTKVIEGLTDAGLRNSNPLLASLNHGFGNGISPIRTSLMGDLQRLGVETINLPSY